MDIMILLNIKDLKAICMFEFHGYWAQFNHVEYCQNMNATVT